MKTIVRMKFGSHLYGTNTPESDLDYKAIHIPNAGDILLGRVQDSVSTCTAKVEGTKNEAGDHDEESYSLQRYLKLLSEGQIPALDMLFASEDMILETSDVWKFIQAHRSKLLTRKSAAFLGYCRQQANKYGIRGSRVAAARDAANLFKEHLDELGPQAKVLEMCSHVAPLLGEHTKVVQQKINAAGDIGSFFEICNRKIAFNSTIKQAYEICDRIHQSYGQRALLAESNEGVDWKALSHAVRVGYEAIELLDTHKITFPLRNAADIFTIKQGKLPYNEVAKLIEELLALVEDAAAKSTIQDETDHEFIDNLVMSEYAVAIGDEFYC